MEVQKIVRSAAPVTERLALLHAVRGENDAGPVERLPLQILEDVPELAPGDRVDAAGGLVEHDEHGAADQRHRHA